MKEKQKSVLKSVGIVSLSLAAVLGVGELFPFVYYLNVRLNSEAQCERPLSAFAKVTDKMRDLNNELISLSYLGQPTEKDKQRWREVRRELIQKVEEGKLIIRVMEKIAERQEKAKSEIVKRLPGAFLSILLGLLGVRCLSVSKGLEKPVPVAVPPPSEKKIEETRSISLNKFTFGEWVLFHFREGRTLSTYELDKNLEVGIVPLGDLLVQVGSETITPLTRQQIEAWKTRLELRGIPVKNASAFEGFTSVLFSPMGKMTLEKIEKAPLSGYISGPKSMDARTDECFVIRTYDSKFAKIKFTLVDARRGITNFDYVYPIESEKEKIGDGGKY